MSNKTLIISGLVFLSSCSHSPVIGERRLSSKEVPAFMSEIRKAHPNAKFYEKTLENKIVTYEAKYKEVSLTYDSNGILLETEIDVKFSSLDREVKAKILKTLQQDYKNYKILECEIRKIPGQEFIDVEIRHSSSPSGYWELSFTSTGEYHSREIENYEIPLTHN
jgi:hypothetical protein